MRYKYFIFNFILVLLLLPFLQQKLKIVVSKSLWGSINPTTKIELNPKTWFAGDYQVNYEKLYDENLGFRSDFTRLINQIDFSLFRTTTAGINIGIDDYLFEYSYIEAVTGKDFIGKTKIKTQFDKIRYVADRLKEKSIDLLIVMAPNKARFFYDKIPNHFKSPEAKGTNYDEWVKLFSKSDLHVIDFNSLFQVMNDTSHYKLFPRYGIHWSIYGGAIAGDSIIRYIEHIRSTNLNDVYWKNIELSNKPLDTDYDLGNLLNIVVPLDDTIMVYPKLEFEQNPEKPRLKVLTIGDSFYWTFSNLGYPQHVFSQNNFWYYNHQIYADSLQEPSVVDPDNFMTEVEKQDVIIIFQTEGSIDALGFSFFENAYNYYNGNLLSLNYFINRIKNDPKLLNEEVEKANKRGIPLEQMIREDAEWLRKNEDPQFIKQERIRFFRNQIKTDTNLMQMAKQQAKEQNISLEEMIMRDAEWLYDQELKKR